MAPDRKFPSYYARKRQPLCHLVCVDVMTAMSMLLEKLL